MTAHMPGKEDLDSVHALNRDNWKGRITVKLQTLLLVASVENISF